ILLRKVDQRGDQLPLGQVSGNAEDDHHTRRGFGSKVHLIRAHLLFSCPIRGPVARGGAQCPDFFSTCPPNWNRMAESTLAAKSSSPREAKRWYSDAVNTGAGAVDSMAARTVQRPSPESETRPEKRSNVG